MAGNVWWLLTLPCVLVALLLIGAPELPALNWLASLDRGWSCGTPDGDSRFYEGCRLSGQFK